MVPLRGEVPTYPGYPLAPIYKVVSAAMVILQLAFDRAVPF